MMWTVFGIPGVHGERVLRPVNHQEPENVGGLSGRSRHQIVTQKDAV